MPVPVPKHVNTSCLWYVITRACRMPVPKQATTDTQKLTFSDNVQRSVHVLPQPQSNEQECTQTHNTHANTF